MNEVQRGDDKTKDESRRGYGGISPSLSINTPFVEGMVTHPGAEINAESVNGKVILWLSP